MYPPVSDPVSRAVVDSALAFASGTLYPTIARACYPTLGYGTAVPDGIVDGDLAAKVPYIHDNSNTHPTGPPRSTLDD